MAARQLEVGRRVWGAVMSRVRHRRKGDRVEREIVDRHRALGFDPKEAPTVAEVKARGNGDGFVQLEKRLGEYDALFLRRNHADPLMLLPWRIWARLLRKRAS